MKAPAILTAALCSAFWGFTALSLAMDRHHEDAYGRGNLPGARRAWQLRAAGTAGLLLSLLACLTAQGPTRGWVLWLGVLTACGLPLILLHTYAPGKAARAGLLALGASLLAGAAALVSG